MVLLWRSMAAMPSLARMPMRITAVGSVRASPAVQRMPLRSFSSQLPATDDTSKKATAAAEEEPLTNKKLWDRVLADQPQQDERKNSDLLYENPRKGYFGILSAGSLAHIAFWSWLKGYEESLVEMFPVAPEPSSFAFITNDLGSTLGFGSSIMLAFLIGFHARRAVARISVVGGGDKLRITTHKFFGDLGEPFDVPVSHVSANPNTKKNIILKVGKDRGFYLVDVNGQFYNRKKLESMITFRTDFTEHEKLMDAKEKAKVIEVRTDLPRTELKTATGETPTLPKRMPVHKSKVKGNLLGRKPTGSKKPKTRK
ncbi:hypothetical protein ATCC90586_010168 [Pythium insidiosum]|nr:hypothetical protein ATCC90586_010168 [Pythium insidiosum]